MFKVGDKVKAWGLSGVVTEQGSEDLPDPHRCINVRFEDGRDVWFLPDGRTRFWHKEPTLFYVNGGPVDETR